MLSAGTRLGVYEIHSVLGGGGMDTYRPQDAIDRAFLRQLLARRRQNPEA